MSAWQQWLQHPEKVWIRRAFFRLHLWVGAAAGLYIVLMSISGSILVYRNDLEGGFPAAVAPVEWLVDFHENLLSGGAGRFLNGVGAACVMSLCVTGAVIWWPGIDHWRRGLTVEWRSHVARVNWDAHSAVGFWSFFFVLMWAVSGAYFSFPRLFNSLFGFFDPHDRFTDKTLLWLSLLHFGRFGWFAEALWALLGLTLAVLSLTGVFICCHRILYKSTPSRHHSE